MKLDDIPSSIQLAWHGVNDRLNLEHFLKSPIPWGEGDVRGDGNSGLVLRHDGFDSHPMRPGENLLRFEEWLEALQSRDKYIKIDLKEGGGTMEKMIRLLKERKVDESRLWITTNLKDVSTDDYARLRTHFPHIIFQSTVPLRFMFQFMGREDRVAWLQLNQGLGVTRLSISWFDNPSRDEVEELRSNGFEINFYHVNSLDDFRRAVALEPEAITSDFHVPEWNLFGRGSGENGFYLEPALVPLTA
jgi:hypothetical protein